jgi:hypothetical protein
MINHRNEWLLLVIDPLRKNRRSPFICPPPQQRRYENRSVFTAHSIFRPRHSRTDRWWLVTNSSNVRDLTVVGGAERKGIGGGGDHGIIFLAIIIIIARRREKDPDAVGQPQQQ